MGNKYVDIAITRQTQALSQKGFGLPLILSTEKLAEYKEYTDLAAIGTDFGAESETYKLAAKLMGQTPKVATVAVYGFVYDSTSDEPTALVNTLNELLKKHNDFYYLVATEQGDDEIKALSNWIASQEKLYFASTSNPNLAAELNNDRAILLVHDKPETYPAEAWVGVGAPLQIGSFTWTFKTLNTILPVAFDTTQVKEIEDNNASTYIREGGVNITSKGVSTSGEYIDTIQGQDYLSARITEDVFGVFVRNLKVPFTDGGISMVVAAVEGRLKDGADKGIIAKDSDGQPLYTITAPTAASVAANDKANRTLPDINWEATIEGAIEKTVIRGVLKL